MKSKDLQQIEISQFHLTFLAPRGIWVYSLYLDFEDLDLNSGSTTS